MKRLTPLLLLLALACGREAPRPAAQAAAAADVTAAGVTADATAAAAVDVAATAEVSIVPPEQPHRWFRSPTGNIGCGISATAAACDIREKTWTPPAKPSTCEFDWGTGVHLEVGARATTGVTCASDTVLNDDMPVLAYGTTVTLGRIHCESHDDGMRCVDTLTDHGFVIGRSRYSLF